MNILKEMLKPKLYRNPLHVGALRNVPCVCGSGKKIKKCHGNKYALPMDEAKEISELINQYGNKEKELQKQINKEG